MDIQNILNGKLTYLAAAAFFLVGLFQCVKGDYQSGVQNILGGVAIAGGRRAIGNITISGNGK